MPDLLGDLLDLGGPAATPAAPAAGAAAAAGPANVMDLLGECLPAPACLLPCPHARLAGWPAG